MSFLPHWASYPRSVGSLSWIWGTTSWLGGEGKREGTGGMGKTHTRNKFVVMALPPRWICDLIEWLVQQLALPSLYISWMSYSLLNVIFSIPCWMSYSLLNMIFPAEYHIPCWMSYSLLNVIFPAEYRIPCWISYSLLNIVFPAEYHIPLLNVVFPCWISYSLLNVGTCWIYTIFDVFSCIAWTHHVDKKPCVQAACWNFQLSN